MNSRFKKKEIKGLMISTVSLPVALIAISILIGKPDEGIWAALFSLPFCIVATIFVALPAITVLKETENEKFIFFLTIPVIITFILTLIFLDDASSSYLETPINPYLGKIIFLFLMSLFPTLVYWFIVRPDKTE